jgi:hypothetical protein
MWHLTQIHTIEFTAFPIQLDSTRQARSLFLIPKTSSTRELDIRKVCQNSKTTSILKMVVGSRENSPQKQGEKRFHETCFAFIVCCGVNLYILDRMVTPLHLVRANLDKLIKSNGHTTPVVLLSTGAYNPVHRMHIDIFARAKASLEGLISIFSASKNL